MTVELHDAARAQAAHLEEIPRARTCGQAATAIRRPGTLGSLHDAARTTAHAE